MLKKLKERWKISSDWQLVLIFFIFSVTGSAATYVRRIFFDFVGITSETSLLIKIPLYIVTLIPAYYILLIFFGTIFGQRVFFLGFAKKSFGRFIRKRKK